MFLSGIRPIKTIRFTPPPQENDYIDSYFDNGEDFAAGSDDNMDGEATY